ncbi:MAG: 3-deoxy-D-manno-octulosonate 8-phosphate phosphatase [Flavobacteriaceae bacterium]|nr:MAG: 3-deoxy-D-manno-octulosonate 8-phosphate phosphatase [Flavobacteriaceae bacterium]
MEKSYKEIMPQITTFIFDVDGVLTDGTIQVLENGDMIRNMNIKDGYALKTAVDAGYKVCIISGGSSEGVRVRLERLGLTDVYLGAHNKIEQFNEIIKKHHLKAEEVLYMGDDIPDYPVMKLVGLACSPKDAAPEIQGISHYISQKNGGKGCVRDVIEQVLKVRGDWDGKFDAKYD